MKKFIIVLLLSLNFGLVKAQSTDEYIAEYRDLAQHLMHEHRVPASIILAVAIHESAAGKSKIARYLNNHFGIKGKNSNTQIRSAYKDFPTVDSSYYHFITFLKSRKHYNHLFEKDNPYDYKAWARGIQRGGYAVSKTWASKVISLIQRHRLYEIDNRPEDYVDPVEISPVSKAISKTYTVKSGDNLSIIAKKYKTTVNALKRKNGLKSNIIKPGKKLKI